MSPAAFDKAGPGLQLVFPRSAGRYSKKTRRDDQAVIAASRIASMPEGRTNVQAVTRVSRIASTPEGQQTRRGFRYQYFGGRSRRLHGQPAGR